MGKNKYVFSSQALLTPCEDCQSSLIHNPYKAIDLYPNISTNTKKNYRYYVNTLRKMLKYEYPNLSEQEHLDLLVDFPLMLAKLEQFFESQQFVGMYKNLLAFLCKFFSNSKEFELLHDQYSEVLTKVSESQARIRSKNEKNEKESRNWVEFSHIEAYLETMIKDTEELQTQLSATSSVYFRNKAMCKSKRYIQREKQHLKRVQETLILASYVLCPPIRNDWPSVKIKNFNKIEDNFLQLNEKGGYDLFLNDYKTYKIYGQIKIPLSEKFSDLIKDFLQRKSSSMQDSDYLFQPFSASKYSNSNFSKYLVRIMKRNFPGKNVNIQMLRKIYTSSEKFESVQKSKEIARCMGHSFQQHFLYYKKPSAFDRRKEILFFLNKAENKEELKFNKEINKWHFGPL